MTDVVDRFLAAVAARDWDEVAACFAPEARLRMQSPGPLRDEQGPEAIAERYRAWFGDLDGFKLRDRDRATIGDRTRVHYAVAGGGKLTEIGRAHV